MQWVKYNIDAFGGDPGVKYCKTFFFIADAASKKRVCLPLTSFIWLV